MGKKESDLLARKKIWIPYLDQWYYWCMHVQMPIIKLQQDSWLVYGTKRILLVFAALENNAFCVDRYDFFTFDQNIIM